MSELLRELFVAVVSENDERAKEIMETIDFEYETLWNIIDSKISIIRQNESSMLSLVKVFSNEITRLEKENKELKKELKGLKK